MGSTEEPINMFRVLSKVASSGMRAVSNNSRLGAASQVRMMSGAKQESDAEFDAKYLLTLTGKTSMDGRSEREWLTSSQWIWSLSQQFLQLLSVPAEESTIIL